ncbi:hypothetical protein [Comamonas guangdongensis]|uniref:Uncharacterized protein n=1 Tax=Comamonas guangdongensis TaxID=510515 RepID=A0ABV3ZVH8_9BURK
MQGLQAHVELLQPGQLLADRLHAIANLAVRAHHAGARALSPGRRSLVSRRQGVDRIADPLDLLTQTLLRLLGILASNAKALQFGLSPRKCLLLLIKG